MELDWKQVWSVVGVNGNVMEVDVGVNRDRCGLNYRCRGRDVGSVISSET